jgi:hypothetical protein
MQNQMTIVLSTNNENLNFQGDDPRRYQTIKVPAIRKDDSEYFTALAAAMDRPDFLPHLYWTLKNVRLGDFHPRKDRVITDEHRVQTAISLRPFDDWIWEALHEGAFPKLPGRHDLHYQYVSILGGSRVVEWHDGKWPRVVTKDSLRQAFRDWAEEGRLEHEVGEAKDPGRFSQLLVDRLGLTIKKGKPRRVRIGEKQKTVFELPTLEEARAAFRKSAHLGDRYEFETDPEVARAKTDEG